jgi:hypothetical protein
VLESGENGSEFEDLGLYQFLALGGEGRATQAEKVVAQWRKTEGLFQSSAILDQLRESKGGQNLLRIGRDDDIEAAAKIDSLDVVGKLGRKPTRISRV